LSSSGAPAPRPQQPPASQAPKPQAPPQPPEVWKAFAEKLKDLNPVYEPAKGYLDFVVRPDQLVEAAKRLKEMGFDHVISVGAVDYPAKKQITSPLEMGEGRKKLKVCLGPSA